jgi:hypothetical protein
MRKGAVSLSYFANYIAPCWHHMVFYYNQEPIKNPASSLSEKGPWSLLYMYSTGSRVYYIPSVYLDLNGPYICILKFKIDVLQSPVQSVKSNSFVPYSI